MSLRGRASTARWYWPSACSGVRRGRRRWRCAGCAKRPAGTGGGWSPPRRHRPDCWSGRRRSTPFTTPPRTSRDALQAHGRALDICLAQSYTAHYVAECAEGKAFLLGICDTRTGAPRSTAELGLHRDWAIRGYGVELRQFTGRGNALPSPACRTALDEVLASVPTPAMQEHLARTAMALAERRRLGKDAATRRARLLPLGRALRVALGEPLVDALLAEALRSAPDAELAGPG